MRTIGDKLYIVEDNKYKGKLCEIKKIHNVNGNISYDVDLVEKKLNSNIGAYEIISFINIHYNNLKKNI